MKISLNESHPVQWKEFLFSCWVDVDGRSKTFKTTFICVVEDDTEATGEPKYVWVNGKLTAKRNEDASADRKYKCKVIRNGYKRINKIARDLKSYSKSIKKMTKYLENISHIVN